MPWIDVEDAKSHLNKSGITTDDDVKVQGFIDAACAMCERAVGHIDVVAATEDVAVNRLGQIVLRERPVNAVTSVSTLAGDGTEVAVPALDNLNGVAGWELLSEGGIVAVPATGTVRVVYSAGLDPVPGDYRLAALTLVEHHWRQSQMNAAGGRPNRGDMGQMVMPGFANALPYRVRELLGLHGKEIRSEVFVG